MSDYVHKDSMKAADYVTMPPIDPVYAATADVHGVYPVSPLGFPDTGMCVDAACIGKGNPEFPQSRNFSVEMDVAGTLPDEYIEVSANVPKMAGMSVCIPVERLDAENGIAGTYRVAVKGDIASALAVVREIEFGNAGYDDYSVTGIVGNPASVVGDAELTDGTTWFTVQSTECIITGHVGCGRLTMSMDVSGSGYVLLLGQDNHAENGLYRVMGESDGWVRIASEGRVKGEPMPESGDPYNDRASIDNSVLCGHLRHGYSDREVTEYVEDKVGHVVSNARHPMSAPGDLAGAGQLVKWFVDCGAVDLGHSHRSGIPVTVEGFGLGGFMTGECTYGNMCPSRRAERDDGLPVETPVISFSVGTGRPEPGTEDTSLPRDWPFTPASAYSGSDIDNNITLLKVPALLSDGSRSVGGLRHEVYDSCPKCGGTGEIGGNPCPMCDGDGEVIVAHSDSSRIHVCVNNDFTPNADGTVTPKKTYVHLAAPINTPDGDEFEVTVSLPVVSSPNRYGDDPVKNVSAYYEYVSSPRVVVLGGYWKFSDSRVTWHESDRMERRTYMTGTIDIVGEHVHPFTGKDGKPIARNSRIRFTLDGGTNCPRYTVMMGAIMRNEEGRITINALENYPYTSRLRDTRMTICGVAYLDADDDGLPTGTDTLMGLHSRNKATLVRDDGGSGEPGSLDEYNKFIKPLDGNGDPGRTGLCTGDARQVLAAVYPTVTSTFPWHMVGRHRMKHLDMLMTDEWDLGENSVSAMIWDSNRRVIDFTDTVDFFGYGDSCYGFTADTMPVRYSVSRFSGNEDQSVIGSQIRIKVGVAGYREAACNPVRQARKAASMFADDFRKLRMFHGGKLPKVSGASRIRTSAAPIEDSLADYFSGWTPDASPSETVTGNRLASAAWLSKARHLPEYVIVSGQDMGSDGNSLIGADPFVEAPASERYTAGFAREKYSNGYYDTMDGHTVIPCDVTLPGHGTAFSYRSVISARVASDPDAVEEELYGDASRVAELQKVSIDSWKTGLGYDFTSPYSYLVDDSGYRKWMDIYSATSNVFSVDTVPVPDDCAVPDLPEGQKAMISGDPMAVYNSETGMALDFVSANLPFYDEGSPRSIALTNMLRRMVSPFGARMPVRFWDGTRVAIAVDGVKNNRIAELTRLEWPESECDMSSATRCDIVDDEFMAKSADTNTVDVNLNSVAMETSLHMNWSAPYAKVGRSWYNRVPFTGTGEFAGRSGYVRVYMKFKFSAQAGRWYTVDYRQAPMSYLTPLYGARALEEKVDGTRLWSESMCAPHGDWKDVLMHPYYKYAPMDINPEAIPKLVENVPDGNADIDRENRTDLVSSTVSLPRFSRPYMPVAEGGLGLNAPCDANGYSAPVQAIAAMPHANFWSVRKHLRPAVSAPEGADIPGFRNDALRFGVVSRKGGTMGDPLLWGQFDFPMKGLTEYTVPPYAYDTDGDKLVMDTGEYVAMSDGSMIEMR